MMTSALAPQRSTTATDTPARPRVSGRNRRPGGRRALFDGLVFLAPFLIVYVLFLVVPVVQAFVMSGYQWDLLSGDTTFVGLQNYVRMFWGTQIVWSLDNAFLLRGILLIAAIAVGSAMYRRATRAATSRAGAIAVIATGALLAALLGFHPGRDGAWNDPGFWISLQNTLVFTAVSTPLLVVLGLLIAVALNTRRRGVAAYRAAFFLPYVLPISAVTLIWSYLLNADRGLISGALSWVGLPGISFLSDPNLALPAIIATTIWWSVGFNVVLFLAGLQDIEPSLLEAASLDGANRAQRFRHIVIPGLSHVMVLVVVTQLIASFQIFGQVYIMTKGGPGTATEVIIQHIYESGFRDYQLGYAAAVSVFLFLVMAAVSAVQFRLLTRGR